MVSTDHVSLVGSNFKTLSMTNCTLDIIVAGRFTKAMKRNKLFISSRAKQ